MTVASMTRPEGPVQALQRTEALLEAGLHEVRALLERFKDDGGDEAMATYSRQPTDPELIQYATEIKVRAERRCGELLRDTAERGERASRGEPVSQMSKRATSAPPTLADMGLTRDESSRYQQLAAMPAEHFETAVATAKAAAGGLPQPSLAQADTLKKHMLYVACVVLGAAGPSIVRWLAALCAR